MAVSDDDNKTRLVAHTSQSDDALPELAKELLSEIINAESDPSPEVIRSILQNYCQPGSRSELPQLDVKLGHDGSKRSKAELTKDIVAMANSGGGLILFGIDGEGNRIGCSDDLAGRLDPAKIADQLTSRSVRAPIETTCHVVDDQSKRFVLLRIRPTSNIIVFESDYSVEMNTKQPVSVITRGVVYVRRAGGNAFASQSELTDIVDRIWQYKIHRFLAKVERIAALPDDTDLIAQNTLDPTQTYVLNGDKTGIPVRVVEHPNAVPVAISDSIAADRPFDSVHAEITSQVRLWLQSNRKHRVQPSTLASWFLRRDEFQLDDDIAEFGFMSAGYGHGLIMYWASGMSEQRLRKVVTREIERMCFPMIDVIPYVVASFLWNDRVTLLSSLTSSNSIKRDKVTRLASKVSTHSDPIVFRRHGRSAAKTFHMDGRRISYAELHDDPANALAIFCDLVGRDSLGISTGSLRAAAHQLDIILHARTIAGA